MKKARKTTFWLLVCLLVTWLSASQALADGGYFSERSVAVNADQRAIIIKNGNQISMTFSTGYTGEREDFAWVIPTPVPPAVEHVAEAGESGENLFKVLDRHTAPVLTNSSGGCFPAGTEVFTDRGPPAPSRASNPERRFRHAIRPRGDGPWRGFSSEPRFSTTETW